MEADMEVDPIAASTGELLPLLAKLQDLRASVTREQREIMKGWRPHIQLRSYHASAANLAAYIGLRRRDIRGLQAQLSAYGLSSLGRSEAHVLPTLDTVIQALKLMLGTPLDQSKLTRAVVDEREGNEPLAQHANALFGKPPEQRCVRIMVTLPREAAFDAVFVRELLLRGMNCARINCAHDDRALWQGMIEHIRTAEQATGRRCKILMDLAGPKIRTGPVLPGPAVVHLKPKRDAQGRLAQAVSVILDASGQPGCNAERDSLGRHTPARIAVDRAWLEHLQPGDRINFTDLRGRAREWEVKARLSDTEILALSEAGAYLAPGTELTSRAQGKDDSSVTIACGGITAPPLEIRLRKGERLWLTRAADPGRPAQADDEGNEAVPAQIGCMPGSIFDDLKANERVWIDDGRIGARIESVDESGAWLVITHARPEGEKLKPEKGLNFPDSNLQLPALTEDDLTDLDFAVEHADLIGYSFVRGAEDMDALIEQLAVRNGAKLGVIAKIENRAAIHNLPQIIIRGAGRHAFGVMIARGDLAVEIGYERLAEIQEEILWICEAAHVPVVWATHVLEGLVKQQIPTRAEMTDAAMSERAECVMLNKGPFVLDAIAVLDDVVSRMQDHQSKKTAQLRALHW